ncbi:MAG: methylcobamide--CoM methyltransferase, partial [Candidatus Bathyarchaeota archaeon]
FVDFSTEIVIEYAKAQFRAGSHIVEVADAMASQDMISPIAFRRFVKPALTNIANHLDGIRVLHICGRTAQIWPDLAAIDFNGLSVEAEIAQVKPILGNMKILGNVSSKKTLVLGSPDDVKAEAKKALEEGADLLEPECGFSPSTPIENIQALVTARDEYYS